MHLSFLRAKCDHGDSRNGVLPAIDMLQRTHDIWHSTQPLLQTSHTSEKLCEVADRLGCVNETSYSTAGG